MVCMYGPTANNQLTINPKTGKMPSLGSRPESIIARKIAFILDAICDAWSMSFFHLTFGITVHTCCITCSRLLCTGLPNVTSLKTRLLALEVLKAIVIGSRSGNAIGDNHPSEKSGGYNSEDSQYTAEHCYEVSPCLCITEL